MKKILVVDNNPMMLRFMQYLLEKQGHIVRTATNGLSALVVLEEFLPDICFIDLIMENISGDKLLKIIRELPQHKDTFIVIVSAVAVEDTTPFADYQADAFIAKGPFEEMSKHVLRIVNLLDTPEINKIKGLILGKEQLHAREITRELLDSRAHFQVALNNISEGYLEIFEEKIIYANPAALSIIGRSEAKILNTCFVDLFDTTIFDELNNLLIRAKSLDDKVESEQPLAINGKLVLVKIIPVSEREFHSTLVILSDVSRQKYLEAQLRNTQKMEAISTLAGGVAHDLNNILSGVVSYPDSLISQLPPDNELIRPLQIIKASGEKAAIIVQDLLTLSQRNCVQRERVELNHVISDYFNSAEYKQLVRTHPDVDISINLEADLEPLLGVPIHLYKLVMNLVSNAYEAISGRGTVTVRTEHGCPDDASKNIHHGGAADDYIALQISDSGIGLSDQERDRIFEPFYSKKKMGRSGTGLGMAVVWGVVSSHEACIDVKSSVGQGTKITVCFPACGELTPKTPSKDIDDVCLSLDRKKVLVVDDADEQREIATNILESLGFEVATASGGEQAVELLQQEQIDLVLLDMIMEPGLDGLETYRRIISFKPEQKVIIVSGYSTLERVRTALKLGAKGFIQKPYTVLSLKKAIRDALYRSKRCEG